jgi:proline dehydrogenase
MLRAFFVSLSKAAWAQRTITHWGFAWRAASRFIAGESSDAAIQVVRQLNQKGIHATLDHLGENTSSPPEAQKAVAEILETLELIQINAVSANVSVKLSQIGLCLDETLCRNNLFSILTRARELNNFIRIDMEDSALTDRTLSMYHAARAQGFDNVGIVLQAYLYRTQADLGAILGNNGRVRLCKGAYNEPATVAFPRKQAVDQSFDQLATRLLQGASHAGAPQISPDGRTPPIPALATHDPQRIQSACQALEALGLPKQAAEFQLLYGIRRDLQAALAASGYPVRVYVPYGTHWYPYFMRRLGERPANVWFFVSNFFHK